jgi:hypothetical protein
LRTIAWQNQQVSLLTPKHPRVFFTKIASKQPLLKTRWIL